MRGSKLYTFDKMRMLLHLADKRPRHEFFWDRLVPYGHPRVYTSQEVNDFAYCNNVDIKIPEEPRIIYMGPEFAVVRDKPEVRYLRTPRLAKPYIAGIVHVSVQALEETSQELMEALCKHVYDYNYVVRRYRSHQPVRHVYLHTHLGDRDYALQVKKYLDRHYPDTVCLADQEHTLEHI